MKINLQKVGRIMLSFLLLTAMIFPTLLVDSVSASTVNSDDYITINFKNPKWSIVNVHFWCDEDNITSTWPGCRITETETAAYTLGNDDVVVTKFNKSTDLYTVYLSRSYDWTGILFNSLASSSESSSLGTNKTSNLRNLDINDGNTWIMDTSGGHWQESRSVPPYIAGDMFSPNKWETPFQEMLDGGTYYYYNTDRLSASQPSVTFKVVDRDTWTNSVSPPSNTQYCNNNTTKNINATLVQVADGNNINEKATLTNTSSYDRIQIRVEKESGDIYAVGMKAPAVESVPRIKYTVPHDSWQRDFTMTEQDSYYNCTINSQSAQIFVYDKTSGEELAGLGYAGLDAMDDESVQKNINTAFSLSSGSMYKNVNAVSSESNTIDIRVDKSTGLIYGVCGTEQDPVYPDNIVLKSKTASDNDFTVCEDYEIDDNSRYQVYTFNDQEVDLDFLYNNTSINDTLNFKTDDANLNGINLYKKNGANYYTAEIIDKDHCDKIQIIIDKTLASVTAKALNSTLTYEENKLYYLEGRFICKDTNNNSISVNNSSWSDTSVNIPLTKTENNGIYKLDTNSTIADLTSTGGASYSFYIREGTQYPAAAAGKCYSPSSNTTLKDIPAGQKLTVRSGNTASGGFFFNDKSKTSGKVTLWFDISDQNNPTVYYTTRYENISAKAMYCDINNNLVDKTNIAVEITPSSVVQHPEGAAVSAEPLVSENGMNYSFTGWTTVGGTGMFEDETNPTTTFYPTADNETVAAIYKVGYSITVENSVNGKVTASSEMVGVGEEFTLSITPNEGYTLTSLEVDNVDMINETVGRRSFTGKMPSHAVTVKAAFEPAEEVYFYAAVPTIWGESHKNINVVVDGVKITAEKVFETVVLYDYNSATRINPSDTFNVNLLKAEKHSKVVIGEPVHADGTIDANCYGHVILSGELEQGNNYYYYSQGSGVNFKGIIESPKVELTCDTAEPKTEQPVDFSYTVTDCNGKTAGQESYTIQYSVEDPDGTAVEVTDCTFVPSKKGTYTIKAWADAEGVKSAVKQIAVDVTSDEPEPQDITVEFKYYDRDDSNPMELSDTESTVSVSQTVTETGLKAAVVNAYSSVEDRLRKNMNLMSEYYFCLSQSEAVQGIKAHKNYREVKTDAAGNIERDTFGIALYKNYGECYTDEELQFHTDAYGVPTSTENWVIYYAGSEIVDEQTANDHPEAITKIVVWGFNNPRIYRADITYTTDETADTVVCVDENDGLYSVAGSTRIIYDAFYNMNLAKSTDYSEGGYLSNFAISDYYGNDDMPTAIEAVNSADGKYVFDGWYDSTNGENVKVSSDLNYTSRITNNVKLTALYKKEDNVKKTPVVTVSNSDIEKYTDGDVEKIRLNTIINVFNCDTVDQASIIYVRLKSTDETDWENNYTSIDFESLKAEIMNVISTNSSVGRKITVVTLDDGTVSQVIADCYQVVLDEKDVNAADYKIMLNNKNRVQFSNSFTAASAHENGSNSAILAFAAAKNSDEWILSDNYIPYMNTGK